MPRYHIFYASILFMCIAWKENTHVFSYVLKSSYVLIKQKSKAKKQTKKKSMQHFVKQFCREIKIYSHATICILQRNFISLLQPIRSTIGNVKIYCYVSMFASDHHIFIWPSMNSPWLENVPSVHQEQGWILEFRKYGPSTQDLAKLVILLPAVTATSRWVN